MRALLPGIHNVADRVETRTKIESAVQIIAAPMKALPRPNSSPLVQDLEARLKIIKERGPVHGRPQGAVQKFGVGEGDQRDDVRAEAPRLTLDQHPRAYKVPASAPRPEPQPQRPGGNRSDDPNRPADSAGVGHGVPHSGGMKVS
jgi:hypothetical protein